MSKQSDIFKLGFRLCSKRIVTYLVVFFLKYLFVAVSVTYALFLLSHFLNIEVSGFLDKFDFILINVDNYLLNIIVCVACFFVFCLLSIFSSLLLNNISIDFETYLKKTIISNENLFVVSRLSFVNVNSIRKSVYNKYIKARAVSKVLRAQVSAFPSVILLLIIVSYFIYSEFLFTSIVVVSIGVFFVFVRKVSANVNLLEDEYLSVMSKERKSFFGPSLFDKNEDFLKAPRSSMVLYYLRSSYPEFVGIFNVIIFSFFLTVGFFLLLHFEVVNEIYWDVVVFSFAVARLSVSLVSGIAASAAVIVKYIYHSEDVLQYLFSYRGLLSAGRIFTDHSSNNRECKKVFLSPVPVNAYTVTLFSEVVRDMYPTLFQYIIGCYFDDDRVVYKFSYKGSVISLHIQVVENSSFLEKGDVVVGYHSFVKVRSYRELNKRVCSRYFRHSKRKLKSMKSNSDEFIFNIEE